MVNAFVVEWLGPYTDPKKVDVSNILYLITGNLPQGPVSEKIRYVGITTNDPATRFNKNHKFWTLTEDNRKFWVGKIKGCSIQRYSDAEWLLVHFLHLQKDNTAVFLLNERKINEPKNPICVINRWFKANNGEEYVNYIFPFKHIPDMLFWNPSERELLTSKKIYVEK